MWLPQPTVTDAGRRPRCWLAQAGYRTPQSWDWTPDADQGGGSRKRDTEHRGRGLTNPCGFHSQQSRTPDADQGVGPSMIYRTPRSWGSDAGRRPRCWLAQARYRTPRSWDRTLNVDQGVGSRKRDTEHRGRGLTNPYGFHSQQSRTPDADQGVGSRKRDTEHFGRGIGRRT